jgi:hypothetical protein
MAWHLGALLGTRDIADNPEPLDFTNVEYREQDVDAHE